MQKLILKNMGPIKECEINVDEFTVFTGAQATGKSTIAKSIYFFKTVKNDFYELIMKQNLYFDSNESLKNTVRKQLRNKFLQLFGSSRSMDNDLYLSYHYNEKTYIKITLRLKEGYDFISPNFIYFDFSTNIYDFINNHSKNNSISFDKTVLKNQLNELFSDDFETIFIPAGRSLITLLSAQLNYIFTSMDENIKKNIDYCTQKYIELILKIRPSLSEGLDGYFENKILTTSDEFNRKLTVKFLNLIDDVLKGKYIFSSGEERLTLSSQKYVKLNFTSSGQQESIWIFNILAYQIINNTKTFLILEEPESHLYPDAQKEMAELLSLFMKNNNNVMITTHSPYILGEINNMLFANQINDKFNINSKILDRIIDSDKLLKSCKTYHVINHTVNDCVDEFNLIKNEVIDDASVDINEEYDKLFELYCKMEESV